MARRQCEVPGCGRKYYCSKYCNMHYVRMKRSGILERRTLPIEKRLWPNVVKLPSGCWEYARFKDKYGYGRISFNGNKSFLAHRCAWILHNKQDIPAGLLVCHRCDNPPCCNPDHLFLGTHNDNAKDCNSKGRRPQGSRVYISKLTEAQVLKIYKDKRPLCQIARDYGVTDMCIKAIKIRRTWKHLLNDEAR